MKTKSFEQVLEESSPTVKKSYKKELKKVSKKKVTKKPVFKVTKTTGLPKNGTNIPFADEMPNRFADKDFSRFAPVNKVSFEKVKEIAHKKVYGKSKQLTQRDFKDWLTKPTAFLGEIEGEPAINCDKWTAMCVVLVLLCVVAYAMHGDYQALQSGLIN